AEEVSLLEEDRIDFAQVDELGDVEGAVAVGLERLDLLVGERDVLVLRDRVAADQLVRVDDLLVMRAPPLAVDTSAAARVQEVEVNVFRFRGRIKTDGDGYEAERNIGVSQRSESHRSSGR